MHPDDCIILCPDDGHTFHHGVPGNQRVDAQKGRIDYRGKQYSQNYMIDTSHAVIKCIRHSRILPTDAKGWAYLTDVTFALWKDHREYSDFYRWNQPMEAELMLAMELDLGCDRFQCTALTDGFFQHNVMVRAVQGHSGRIGGEINDDLAFTPVDSVDGLYHYSKRSFLDTVVGWHAKGLVTVGLLQK